MIVVVLIPLCFHYSSHHYGLNFQNHRGWATFPLKDPMIFMISREISDFYPTMDWLKSRTIVGLDNPIKPIESIRTINIDVENT